MQNCHLQLADFQVVGELGRGSYGVVFKVRNNADHGVYVIKQIGISHLSSKQEKDALKEVQILRELSHAHIIKYHASFLERGCVHIVMEYAEGGDLHHLLRTYRDKGRLIPEKEVWRYASELVAAVGYLHDRGIIHRDIKPANVLLTKQHRVKLADLGASKASGEVALNLTRIGTPMFLAPELVKQTPYDFKVDIWALGCVLYQLTTLEPPFRGENLIALGNAIVHKQPKPLPSSYSLRLSKLIFSLLEKRPNARPNITEVAAMLPGTLKNEDLCESFIGDLLTSVTLGKTMREEPMGALVPRMAISRPERIVETDLETPKKPDFGEYKEINHPLEEALMGNDINPCKSTTAKGRSQTNVRTRPTKLTVRCLQDSEEASRGHDYFTPQVGARKVEWTPSDAFRPRTSSILPEAPALPALRNVKRLILNSRHITPLRSSVAGRPGTAGVCEGNAGFAFRQPKLQNLIKANTLFQVWSQTHTPNAKKKLSITDLN